MEYFVGFQILCGFFSAFVAARKGRSAGVWWFIGALLPVVGVVLSLTTTPVDVRPVAQEEKPSARRSPLRRASRCCGAYIADCRGCPYFRRRLFGAEEDDGTVGYCEFYGRDLEEKSSKGASRVTFEDG